MPIRILHIMGEMDRGGVPVCLMQYLSKIDRQRFQIDILVHTLKKCAYDDEFQEMGIPIIPCPYTRSPLRYARDFLGILKEFGPYDIIHSHVHQYSGFVLRLARLGGVRRLIVHSHDDTRSLDCQATGWRKLYLCLMNSWIQKYASAGLAVSCDAAISLFGKFWENDPRWQILYCGIDLEPFKACPEDNSLKEKLQIPPDAYVMGYVARFTPKKNHGFLLRILAEVLGQYPNTYLLLIGDGMLMENTKAEAHRLGIADKVIFTGAVSNVPFFLRNAIDVFMFPSLYEGLGLAISEAQATGLPCIISKEVPEEATVIQPLVRRLSLSAPVSDWAQAVIENLINPNPAPSPSQALSLMENSPFNLNVTVKSLEQVYETIQGT